MGIEYLETTAGGTGGGNALTNNGGIFTPETSYNSGPVAKHDCKFIKDVATNGTTTITSASASFASADAGKTIALFIGNAVSLTCTLNGTSTVTTSSTTGLVAGMFVVGAGTYANGGIPSGTTISTVGTGTMTLSAAATKSGSVTLYFTPAYLLTTIASVTNATTAVLTSATGLTTATAQYAAYGTNDTTAINNAIAAAAAVQGKVTLAPFAYMCAGALQDTTHRNSVLLVPTSALTTDPIYSVTLEGTGNPFGAYNGDFSNDLNAQLGTILFSPNLGTGTNPNIISGNGSFNFDGATISNVTLYLNSITFRTMANSKMGAVSEQNVGGCVADNCALDVFSPGGTLSPPAYPTVGIYMPNFENNQLSILNNVYIVGYGIGVWGADHLKISNSVIAACNVGVQLTRGTVGFNNLHMVAVTQAVAQVDSGGFTVLVATDFQIANIPPFPSTGTFDFVESVSGALQGVIMGSNSTVGSLGALTFSTTALNLTGPLTNTINCNWGLTSSGQKGLVVTDFNNTQFMTPLSVLTPNIPNSGYASVPIGNSDFGYFNSTTSTLSFAFMERLGSNLGILAYQNGHVIIGGSIFPTPTTDNGTDALQINGSAAIIVVGKTYSVKGGSNALSGTITLVSGTATVSSTALTTGHSIILTRKVASGVATGVWGDVSTAGQLTVNGAATDNGTYNWTAILGNQ